MHNRTNDLLQLVTLNGRNGRRSNRRVATTSHYRAQVTNEIRGAFPNEDSGNEVDTFRSSIRSNTLHRLADLRRTLMQVLTFTCGALRLLKIQDRGAPFKRAPCVIALLTRRIRNVDVRRRQDLTYLCLLRRDHLNLHHLSRSQTCHRNLMVIHVNDNNGTNITSVRLHRNFKRKDLRGRIITRQRVCHRRPRA